MKRLVNERKFLLFGIAALFGALFADRKEVWLLLFAFALFAACAFSFRKPLVLALCLLFFACGYAHLFLKSNAFSASAFSAGEYEIVGVVEETEKGGFRLTSLRFNGESADGNAVLYLSQGDLPTVGDEISCVALLEEKEHGFFYSDLADDLKYTLSANRAEITGRSWSPFLLAKRAIYTALFSCMEKEPAALSYALLTGSTAFVGDETLSAVRYGGIAHIFAVSGLHIGILYGGLMAIAGLFPVLKRRRIFIVLPFLFFYTGMCGFTSSALRAFCMCAVSGLSRSAGRKYDLLNSLGLAALVVLSLRPEEAFLVGFRLSFLACAGIALFSRFAIPTLSKKLSSSVAGIFSAQLATFPVLMDTFGYVSGASILFNLVLIPFLAPLMAFLLVGIPLSYLSPVFLVPAEGLVRLFLWGITVADLSPFLIEGFTFGSLALLYYAALLAFSDLFRLKRPVRLVGGLLLMAATVALLAIKTLYGSTI